MTIALPISDALEQVLRRQASEAGLSVEQFAARLVERSVRSIEELRALADPIHEAFKQSGMTEDEAVELFEAEKHAMRAERRKKAS